MNQNVKTMKEALTAYHQKAKTADEAIEKALKEYKPDIARERIAQIKANLKHERTNAIDIILKASAQGKADVKKWHELKPDDITDDAKLLQTGLRLNQADFDAMCRKYENNGTMCRLLAEYAEVSNRKVKALHPRELFPEGYLHTMNLPNETSMLAKWDRLTSAAEGIIDRMEGHGFGVGVNNPLVIESVEKFGESE